MSQAAPPEPAKETPRPTESPKGVRRFFTLKWMLGAIGVLIVGGLGSGVWEVVIKPLSFGFTRLVTDAISSVFASYKESLYCDFILGSKETLLFGVLIFVFVGAMFSIAAVAYNDRSLTLRNRRLLKSTTHFTHRLTIVSSAIVMVILMVRFSRATYHNSLVVHFEKALAITAPYMTEKERLQVRARYVQVSSRKEYIELMDSLKKIAESNSVKLPAFDVW